MTAHPWPADDAAYGLAEPPPLPGDDSGGAGLLDDLADWLLGYVSFPDSHAAVAVTLWCAHTHLVGRFDSTPRLALLSPEKQCGKTRVLELLELTASGAEVLSDASPAYLFRRIGAGPVTILLDEADAIWRRGKSADETAEALRSIVNAGHRRSATIGRVQMNGQSAALVRFPVYAPAAIAGIGNLPDTILDRAVIIRMRRRAPGEAVRSFRERTARPEGGELRDRLAAWAGAVADRIGAPWPALPDGVTDRPADVWEPLLAVADAAGGAWPHLAREACTALLGNQAGDSATIGTRLLADLRAVFGDRDAMFGTGILDALNKLDESPWGDWHGKPLDARGLARLLKPYGVGPVLVKIGGAVARGYRRDHLHEPWTRYLAGGGVTTATTVTPQVSDSGAVTGNGRECYPVTPGNALARQVTDVAVVTGTPAGDGLRTVWARRARPGARYLNTRSLRHVALIGASRALCGVQAGDNAGGAPADCGECLRKCSQPNASSEGSRNHDAR